MTKPQLTLVQKRSANDAVAPVVDEDEKKFLEDLRGLIWAKGGSQGGSWKSLAERANLNARTISRFASGETRRPMLFTIRRMFVAIDYVMTIVPRGRGNRKGT